MSDIGDEYSELLEQDLREIRGALFDDTLAVLSPPEPVIVRGSMVVREAIEAMVARHQAGVLVVDAAGCLIGIFTERDVLRRVLGQSLDPGRTSVETVMTPDPQSLHMGDRVAHALHCMSVAGYRTVPIVDAAHRPTGVVTATDVMRWLGTLFPEVVLNLRPGDALKNPRQIDAG